MSLEKALANLADAIADVQDEMKKDGGGSSRRSRDNDDGDAPRRGRGRAADKDDDAPRRGRGRPAADDKDGGKGKLTIEKVRKAYGEYLGEDDGDEYADRREFVEAVLNEVSADMIKDIKSKDFDKVMFWLDRKIAGKKVNFDDDGGEAEPRRGRSLV